MSKDSFIREIHDAEDAGEMDGEDGLNSGYNPYDKNTQYRLWIAYGLGYEKGVRERMNKIES